MTGNRSHRTRLARALAAMSDLTYQAALQTVTRAAESGLLPSVLDSTGMKEALDLLLSQVSQPAPSAGQMRPHYHRLSDLGIGLAPGVAARVAAAAAAGAEPIRIMGIRELAGGWDKQDGEHSQDWYARVLAAGPRHEAEFCDIYPGRGGDVPVDQALDRRDVTGDIVQYEKDLKRVTKIEPRDIDAWAHLGNLYFEMASEDGEIVIDPPPNATEVRRFLRTALAYYQTGVAVGELSIPDPYPGLLPWGWLYNRPFFRAMHGMALSLWRLKRLDQAQATLHNMLWLNPADNQGARFLLDSVRNGIPYEDQDTH